MYGFRLDRSSQDRCVFSKTIKKHIAMVLVRNKRFAAQSNGDFLFSRAWNPGNSIFDVLGL